MSHRSAGTQSVVYVARSRSLPYPLSQAMVINALQDVAEDECNGVRFQQICEDTLLENEVVIKGALRAFTATSAKAVFIKERWSEGYKKSKLCAARLCTRAPCICHCPLLQCQLRSFQVSHDETVGHLLAQHSPPLHGGATSQRRDLTV